MSFEYASIVDIKQQTNTALDKTTYDDQFSVYESVAQKRINKFLGVDTLVSASNTEYLDYTNGLIFLKNYPVISVTSLTIGGSLINSDDYRVFTTDGYIDLKGRTYQTYSDIVVVYESGYETIPEDITYCAVLLVHRMFKNSAANENILDLDSKNFENYSMSYSKEPMPRDCQDILRGLKRLV